MQVTYEQPLNERMRTFLRLEFLFLQAQHFLGGCSVSDSRAALACLLEILNVIGSRNDLKTDILKEMEKHSVNLARLEKVVGVDLHALGGILDELDDFTDRICAINGQPGQSLRQNEFLTSIKQRSAIPGGLCDFDLPAYHYWLQRPLDQRSFDLRQWLESLDAVRSALILILRLTRESTASKQELAVGGFFQRSLDADNPCQLLRVTLPSTVPCYAEISGGKHRFTVRFMEQTTTGRAAQTARDVEFHLSCA